MVSKITIFEPHFDGAQFGPASVGNDHPEETTVEEAEETRGRSRGRTILGLGFVSLALLAGVVAARRIRSGTADTESVEIEHTPEVPAE